MIRYTLACNKRHEFESWFATSGDYDKQLKRKLVACPICGSTKVEKAIMAPRLARTDTSTSRPAHVAAPNPAAPPNEPPGVQATPVAMVSPQERELRAKLKALRDHIVQNAEDVGPKFPDEARKMHYGEAEHRSIYGIASPDEARKLHEEGVEFSPLPVLPDEHN